MVHGKRLFAALALAATGAVAQYPAKPVALVVFSLT